jgi:hypothetical protein
LSVCTILPATKTVAVILPVHERGAVDHQDAVRFVRDLEVGKVVGAHLMKVARLVVVVALGMRVDEII